VYLILLVIPKEIVRSNSEDDASHIVRRCNNWCCNMYNFLMTESSQRIVEYVDGIRQCVPSVVLLYTSVIPKESLKHSFLASPIKQAAIQASRLHQQSLQFFKPLNLSKTCAGLFVITHQTTTIVLRPLALSTTLITLSFVFDILGIGSTLELGPYFWQRS
jgi:hypothetical protein